MATSTIHFVFFAVFTSYIIALFNESCGVYSYKDNIEYKFYNPVNLRTDNPYKDIYSFAEEMGSSWTGHRTFCDNEIPKSRYKIINYLNQTKNIKITPYKKDNIISVGNCDKGSNIYRRTVKETIEVCVLIAGAVKYITKPKNEFPIYADNSDILLGTSNANKYYKSIVDTTKVPPKCIPLISDDPKFNPYHPLLTPKNAATRKVKTFPFLLPDTAFSCPSDSPRNCEHFIEKTISVKEGTSYSITDGIVFAMSSAIGNAISIGNIGSFIKEMSNVIESANSIQKAVTNGLINTESMTTSVKKVVELALANTLTNTNYKEKMNGVTDTSISQNNFNSDSSQGRSSNYQSFFNTMSENINEVNKDKASYLINSDEKTTGWNIGGEFKAFLKGVTLKLSEAIGTLGFTSDIGWG